MKFRYDLVGSTRDPRVGPLTITHVKLSPDYRHAWIHVTPLGGEGDGKKMMQGLEKATGFLRRRLGKILHIRHIPELHFFLDQGIDDAIEMTLKLSAMERAREERELQEQGDPSDDNNEEQA